MLRLSFAIRGIVAAATLASVPALARPAEPRSLFAVQAAVADAPNGFVEMCQRDLTTCIAGNGMPNVAPGVGASLFATAAPAALVTVAQAPAFEPEVAAKLLRHVNGRVNSRVWQVPDSIAYRRAELWQRTGDRRGAPGDCEDIAIEKRLHLIRAGFPADRLFFAVGYKRGLGLHTVLVARLDDADWVLDSASTRVRRWDKVRYTWLRMQTPGEPLRWTRVMPRGATTSWAA